MLVSPAVPLGCTYVMLVKVNMAKSAHPQPLLQLPVPAVLVLPEGRFLHRCEAELERRNKVYMTESSYVIEKDQSG